MFPEETHVKIVKRLDAMEAEVYSLYRKLERLRLDLQSQWRVLPSGQRWSERSHAASQYSDTAVESARAPDAVDPHGQ
jgi:hypothetical protein